MDSVCIKGVGAVEDNAFDIVHARVLRSFSNLVDELGGDPDILLHRIGLDRDGLPEIDASATYQQIVTLVDLAAGELRCRDFGMRLARLQDRDEMLGPLGSVMRLAPTFGEALEYAAAHAYVHSLAAGIWLERIPGTDEIFVGHEILVGRLANRAQAIEQILLTGHLLAMEITGGLARVRRVHFRHPPQSPPRVYRMYFGCEVLFGQHNDGVVFSDMDLARPITTAEASAYEAATRDVEERFTRQRPPLYAEARGLVLRYLTRGKCTNQRIAADLKLHPRTLHRRLAAEGTSFQRVKDAARCELMQQFLQQTDFDLATISEKLGFSEQSVLTRTCIKTFAMSPSRYRQHVKATAILSESIKPDRVVLSHWVDTVR